MSAIAPTVHLPSHVLVEGPIPVVAEEAPATGDFDNAGELTCVKTVEQLNQFMTDNPNFDLNSKGRMGWTILGVAIDKRLTPLIQELLRRDPSLIRKNMQGLPYMCRAAESSKEIVQIFFQKGADINSVSESGTTALYKSSSKRLSDITKYLLLNGAVIYQSAREAELAQWRDPSWNQDTTQTMIAQIEGQLPHIQEVMGEIRKEYTHSFDNFKRRLAKKSCLDQLPDDAGMYIMSFTPNGQRQKQFIEKCDQASSSQA